MNIRINDTVCEEVTNDNAISMSIDSNDIGMLLKNCELVDLHLPEWGCVVYVGKNISPDNISKIEGTGARVVDNTVDEAYAPLWKYEILGDHYTKRYVVKDYTTPLTSYDVVFIKNWVQSGDEFMMRHDSTGKDPFIFGGIKDSSLEIYNWMKLWSDSHAPSPRCDVEYFNAHVVQHIGEKCYGTPHRGDNIVHTPLDLYDPTLYAEVPTDINLYEHLKCIDFGEYRIVNFPSEKGFQHFKVVPKVIQAFVDQVTHSSDKKYIFFCQHIYVHKINWRGNIVFTPHLWEGHPENVMSVPHYSLTMKDIAPISDKTENLFSFVGAEHTHNVRKTLINTYDTCYPTSGWISTSGKPKFFELMENSKFSLCPRGTGIGSIRLFETMGMKRVPVIIADGFIPPLDWKLDWDEFSVRIDEDDAHRVDEILSKYSEEDIVRMAQNAYDVWEEYFSPENMHKVVLIEMDRIRGIE